MHHAYKVLDANETNFGRICRVYDERAEDRSWIFCQRSQAGTNMYLVVHERVPLQEFTLLVEDFYRGGFDADVAGDENVEIRYSTCGPGRQGDLGDLEFEDSEDSGVVRVLEY
jgi:hypothetical protein